jgi:MFS family permease
MDVSAEPVAASVDTIPAPPMKKLPIGALVGTSIYTLGINVVWLSFNNVIIPYQVQRVVSADTKALWVGVIEGVGTAIAVIINIIAGIISDHISTKRFGRRAPVMLLGSLLTAPFIVLGIFVPITLPLVFTIYIGMQFFTNVSSGAFQPTLADFVPEKQRGISAGLKGLFTLIGSVIGVALISALLAANLDTAALIVVAASFVLTTVLNVIAMRPYDKTDAEITPIHLGAALRDMFRIQKVAGGFWWFIFGSFLIYMGLSNFQGFSQYYLQTDLHQTQNQALQSQAIFGGVGVLVSMVFAVAAGIISDRIGRRNIIIFAVIMATVMSIFFPFVPQLGAFFPALTGFGIFLIVASLYSAAIGMVQSVDTALTSDLVPLHAAGKYMAYANLAVGLANAVAPLLFGFILFVQGPLTTGSFTIFFAVTAVFFIISAFIMGLKVVNR